jgi:hypothetical protein
MLKQATAYEKQILEHNGILGWYIIPPAKGVQTKKKYS